MTKKGGGFLYKMLKEDKLNKIVEKLLKFIQNRLLKN